jgi:hypothetical protein
MIMLVIGLFRVDLSFDDVSYGLAVLGGNPHIVLKCMKASFTGVVTEYGHRHAREVRVKTLQELKHVVDKLLSLIHMSSFVL